MTPESVPATWTLTIASTPSEKSRSYVCRKSPGLDAAVVGNGTSGAVIRRQSSSIDSSTLP